MIVVGGTIKTGARKKTVTLIIDALIVEAGIMDSTTAGRGCAKKNTSAGIVAQTKNNKGSIVHSVVVSLNEFCIIINLD